LNTSAPNSAELDSNLMHVTTGKMVDICHEHLWDRQARVRFWLKHRFGAKGPGISGYHVREPRSSIVSWLTPYISA
jgi:hypothetical protein